MHTDYMLPQVGTVLTRRLINDPKQQYYFFVPCGWKSGSSVFVTVHGVKRMAKEHAVEFACFAEVRLLTGADINRLYMFGYSGGGQFVHRYALAYPERMARIVIAAAGWYTFPDQNVNYPRGIKQARGLPDIHFDPGEFLSVSTCVVVGERDIHRDQELNKSGRIDRQQGANRLERGKAWIKAMSDSARFYRLNTPYLFDKIPACNHSFLKCMHKGKMGGRVFRFLFNSPNSRRQ